MLVEFPGTQYFVWRCRSHYFRTKMIMHQIKNQQMAMVQIELITNNSMGTESSAHKAMFNSQAGLNINSEILVGSPN
jgi:hypothetical protein